MPKKPSRPLEHFVFPKAGHPYLQSESLPHDKVALEDAIVTRFVAALSARFGRTLRAPTAGDGWPDFWSAEGENRIGIEIVEVVNPEHIGLQQIRRRYAQRLARELCPTLTSLRGVRIEIVDGYQYRRYPDVSSDDGGLIIASFRNLIEANRARIKAVTPGGYLHLKGAAGPNGEDVAIRVTTTGRNTPAEVWYGESLPVDVERAQSLLAEAIEGKINKRYAVPQNSALWLLAYDVTYASAGQAPAAADRGRNLLDAVEHPFTEVWYMVPTTGDISGFVESVWPTRGFVSHASSPPIPDA